MPVIPDTIQDLNFTGSLVEGYVVSWNGSAFTLVAAPATTDASALTTGTLADERLSGNVARRDQANTFEHAVTFLGNAVLNDANAKLSFAGLTTISGNGFDFNFSSTGAGGPHRNFNFTGPGSTLNVGGIITAAGATISGLVYVGGAVIADDVRTSYILSKTGEALRLYTPSAQPIIVGADSTAQTGNVIDMALPTVFRAGATFSGVIRTDTYLDVGGASLGGQLDVRFNGVPGIRLASDNIRNFIEGYGSDEATLKWKVDATGSLSAAGATFSGNVGIGEPASSSFGLFVATNAAFPVVVRQQGGNNLFYLTNVGNSWTSGDATVNGSISAAGATFSGVVVCQMLQLNDYVGVARSGNRAVLKGFDGVEFTTTTGMAHAFTAESATFNTPVKPGTLDTATVPGTATGQLCIDTTTGQLARWDNTALDWNLLG